MKEFYKKNKRMLLTLTLLGFVVFLSACGASTEPIGPDSTGFWDGVVIYNLSQFILWLSDLFGGSYGLAVIVFTALGQIVLLPLTNYQQKSMEKTQEIQPQIEELREKYSARDEETQAKLQEETKKLQDEAGVNPLMGCLPMLIQMPIFIALYQTVVRTPELAIGNFLWLELGSPDPYYILPILAAVFTLANSLLMSYGNPASKTNAMSFVMPAMIFFITFRVSSSLALYFATSNATRALITLIFNNPFAKRRALEEKEEMERENERRRKRAINKARKTGRSVRK